MASIGTVIVLSDGGIAVIEPRDEQEENVVSIV